MLKKSILFQTGRTGEKIYLRATLVTLENNVKGWRIELDKPLGSNQAVNVEIDVLLGNALEMYPAEIEQKEKQLVSCSKATFYISNFHSQILKILIPQFFNNKYTNVSLIVLQGHVFRQSLRLSAIQVQNPNN